MSLMKLRMLSFSSDITNPRSAGMLSSIVIGAVSDIRGGRASISDQITEYQTVLEFIQVGDFECSPKCVELLCGAAHGRVLNALAKKHKVLDHINKYPEVLMTSCAATQHITEQSMKMVLAHFNKLKPNAVFDEVLAESYFAKIRQGM